MCDVPESNPPYILCCSNCDHTTIDKTDIFCTNGASENYENGVMMNYWNDICVHHSFLVDEPFEGKLRMIKVSQEQFEKHNK